MMPAANTANNAAHPAGLAGPPNASSAMPPVQPPSAESPNPTVARPNPETTSSNTRPGRSQGGSLAANSMLTIAPMPGACGTRRTRFSSQATRFASTATT